MDSLDRSGYNHKHSSMLIDEMNETARIGSSDQQFNDLIMLAIWQKDHEVFRRLERWCQIVGVNESHCVLCEN